MFDIGFWELSVVMVVALLVIGPERLPLVAKEAGLWAGKARRMIASVKADIDLELKAKDLKKKFSVQARPHEFTDVEEEIRRLGKLTKSSHLNDTGGEKQSPGGSAVDCLLNEKRY